MVSSVALKRQPSSVLALGLKSTYRREMHLAFCPSRQVIEVATIFSALRAHHFKKSVIFKFFALATARYGNGATLTSCRPLGASSVYRDDMTILVAGRTAGQQSVARARKPLPIMIKERYDARLVPSPPAAPAGPSRRRPGTRSRPSSANPPIPSPRRAWRPADFGRNTLCGAG
jgi:hypothetical protein